MTEPAPKKRATFGDFAIIVAAAGFAAMMMAGVGTAIAPDLLRMTAPVLCPEDYHQSFITSSTSTNGRGRRSTTYTLHCQLDEAGTRDETIGGFKSFATQTGIWMVIGLVGFFVIGGPTYSLLDRLRRRA